MPDEWIRQLGDPALRTAVAEETACEEVLRAQLRRMADTLVAADGAGLAGPQVGVLRRAFVCRLTPDEPVRALVNPRVVWRSRERAEFFEGCLSFRSVLVAVPRSLAVRVSAADQDGRELALEVEGPQASLLQHEIDHLDGILTLDRAAPADRRRALQTIAATELAAA